MNENLPIDPSILDQEWMEHPLLFDEVQECPEALNSLKYFCEEASDYYIVAAGSLLGIKVKNKKGFPVGKVNFLHLYPMNFFEFLSATNNERLREYLENYETFEPIASPIHDKLIEILKYYLFVGGMPEAVYKYVKYDDFNMVREVQEDILNAYEKDFSKHAPKYQIMKIITIWNQIHKQLAKENKKFIFSYIRKSARGGEFEEAIEWLKDAGLIYKSYNIETPKLPLKAYAKENIFKIFFLDVGLLGALSNLSAKTIIQKNNLFTEFKGALTENFVAEELMASNHENLFYWTSKGTAEIDFIVEKEGEVYPLEVKAGNNKRKKSLIIYGKKYSPLKLLRVTSMNLKRDQNIYNYPLYLSGRILEFF